MTGRQIVRAAMPGASDSLCEHVLWGMTPFPFAEVTAKSLYRAASRYRRADDRGQRLCDWCHRLAMEGGYCCQRCEAALSNARTSIAETQS